MPSRRAFLATLIGVPSTGIPVPRLGLHVQGTLTQTDAERTDGYYALCAENGTCHPTEAVGISVHPKNPVLADDMAAMVGHRVQLSLFTR